MPGIGPYVWGEAKYASNLKKHGVDFAIVEHFDLDGAVVFATTDGNMAKNALPLLDSSKVAFTYWFLPDEQVCTG